MLKKYFILIALSFVLILSCGMKRDSLGSQDKIIIIADSTQWIDIEANVLATLERIHYTPQPEPIFNLLHKNPEDLKTLIRFPNMLLVGSLDQDNDMSDLLRIFCNEILMFVFVVITN